MIMAFQSVVCQLIRTWRLKPEKDKSGEAVIMTLYGESRNALRTGKPRFPPAYYTCGVCQQAIYGMITLNRILVERKR
jgi:hypothetical protein